MSRSTPPSVSYRFTALDRLRAAAQDCLPLDALDPAEYALGHALFENRSNQREHITRWLIQQLAARAAGPTRVLSIGCGDGSVDARVAAALAGRGARVDYVGVEPHRPSGLAFAARMDGLTGVHAGVLMDPFTWARPEGRFDVVLAVHSLYYVDDLGTTLRRACGLLAPGGELVVLHAPREPLNGLVGMLAPGHPQAFSAEVEAALRALGRPFDVTRLDSRLDLTATGDPDTDTDIDTERRLFAFTVQAGLPSALVPLVRSALIELSRPGPGLVLSHPVDAFVLRGTPPGRVLVRRLVNS